MIGKRVKLNMKGAAFTGHRIGQEGIIVGVHDIYPEYYYVRFSSTPNYYYYYRKEMFTVIEDTKQVEELVCSCKTKMVRVDTKDIIGECPNCFTLMTYHGEYIHNNL